LTERPSHFYFHLSERAIKLGVVIIVIVGGGGGGEVTKLPGGKR
jgi:hypothetical protein